MFGIINPQNDRSWIYCVGGGSGSGLLLLIVIGYVVYWCCKKHHNIETRTPPPVTYIAPESPNMNIPTVGAIGADQNSVPGQVTVGFQEPVGNRRMVTDYQM